VSFAALKLIGKHKNGGSEQEQNLKRSLDRETKLPRQKHRLRADVLDSRASITAHGSASIVSEASGPKVELSMEGRSIGRQLASTWEPLFTLTANGADEDKSKQVRTWQSAAAEVE
jgi:hypothetical protein